MHAIPPLQHTLYAHVDGASLFFCSSLNIRFAMKILNRLKLAKVKEYRTVDGLMRCFSALDKLAKEYEVVKGLYHRNIMLLFEMINDGDSEKVTFCRNLCSSSFYSFSKENAALTTSIHHFPSLDIHGTGAVGRGGTYQVD